MQFVTYGLWQEEKPFTPSRLTNMSLTKTLFRLLNGESGCRASGKEASATMQLFNKYLKFQLSTKTVLLVLAVGFLLFAAWQFMEATSSSWKAVIRNNSPSPLSNFILEYNRCETQTKIALIPANSAKSLTIAIKSEWGVRVKFTTKEGTEHGDLIPIYYPTSRERKLFIDVNPNYKVSCHQSPRY